jgi:hypothetical protein
MPLFLNVAIKSLRGVSTYWSSAFRLQALTAAIVLQYSDKKGDVYNILWALVFAFATLNILSLVARRFEPERSGLSFGETVAIMVVVVSVFLLGWEMLYLFHILPIKLQPHEQ